MTTANDAYVAWCRYVSPVDWPTRIQLCDSDSPGAFRVFHEREHLKVVEALIASEQLMQNAHQDHCQSEQRASRLFDALTRIVDAYDAYRARGVMPAPWEYAELVQYINDARMHLGDKPCQT